jgi:ornithine decarboxylase
VRDNYQTFAKALPDSRVFYAVKANPAPEVLSLLASMGSCFDTATVAEIEMALAAGATPDRISYRQHDQEGARHRARLRARHPPVRGRLRGRSREDRPRRPRREGVLPHPDDGAGAEWPLSRKFGCDPEMARDVLEHAKKLGLEPHGVSFHVGSQQRNPKRGTARWRGRDRCSATAPSAASTCRMVNMGGGFPTKYLKDVPAVAAVRPGDLPRAAQALRQPHPGDHHRAGPRHGRQCRRHRDRSRADLEEVDERQPRWVYLDIGKFGGLAETMDEAIRYPIRTPHDGAEMAPCVLAGIVMIGFGSIGRGTLPLIERHFKFDKSRMVVIDPERRTDKRCSTSAASRFIQEAVTKTITRSC